MLRTTIALLALTLWLAPSPGLRAQTAADDVADAVRDRGQPCERVISAQRDEAASRPDEAVWLLTCSDASYRVRFKGDTGPQVERLS